MTTNILLLPQLQATFTIVNNGDWTDQVKFLEADGVTSLDLTGITFRGQIRPLADSPVISLEIGTEDGTMVNGGDTGMLSWNVAASKLSDLLEGAYVFDLLATDDDHTINLFEKAGAAIINVNEGVTK